MGGSVGEPVPGLPVHFPSGPSKKGSFPQQDETLAISPREALLCYDKLFGSGHVKEPSLSFLSEA